jgi:hypothetical protein
MADWYYFGIELEMIVEPHTVRDFARYAGTYDDRQEYHRLYYEKLVRSMKKRGVPTKSITSSPSLYEKHGDKTRWFITSDSSIVNDDGSSPALPRGLFGL